MTKTEPRASELLRADGASRMDSAPRVSPPVVIAIPENVDLVAKFEDFAAACSRFCREIVAASSPHSRTTPDDHARLNMQIARTIFGKWSIDILAFLYTQREAGFQEVKSALGTISSRVLSLKLARLEQLGLVRREVLVLRPPRVHYSLTSEGLHVARLGEPVFLYLRLMRGLLAPNDRDSLGSDLLEGGRPPGR